MEIRRVIMISSFLITTFLLISVVLTGMVLSKSREDKINDQFKTMYNDFNSMQLLFLMSENYEDELTCLAIEAKLKEMDMSIWKLGEKIDQYRVATEEFQKDQYYLQQKQIFNENEVFYFLLMKKMIEKCNTNKQMVLFFYKNAADCKKCDDQSFILADINKLDDEKANQQIGILSFDMDLDLSSLQILSKYYKIDNYPCVIIDEPFNKEENKFCGIQDKDFLIKKICNVKPGLQICSIYESSN